VILRGTAGAFRMGFDRRLVLAQRLLGQVAAVAVDGLTPHAPNRW
jgi:hypothetical protein